MCGDTLDLSYGKIMSRNKVNIDVSESMCN